ncbi:aldehyde dehydrogenase [Clostridia bacterium]|nr:aldehyde dehydrogenase [Clostridia bacterium]
MSYSIGCFDNYVNGKFCASSSGETMETKNPANGSLVAKVQKSTVDDVHEAVRVANEAFNNADWAWNPRRRTRALFAWADAIRNNMDDLMRKLSMETGKPLQEARGELMGSIGYLEYYGAMARSLYGGVTSIDKDSYSMLVREPLGAVGIIVPWNYPITLLMRDLAPALAAGNTAVVKPANQTSGITMEVISLLEGIDEIPAGVVNALTGSGRVIGMELVRTKGIEMINFTGSSSTGKTIMREASNTMKKLSLELGGKSASVVFADADFDKAMTFAIRSIFTHAGQLCTSASRLVVEESIKDKVLDELTKRAQALKVGNGLEEGTQMGAISTKDQFDSIMRYIEIARKEGRIVTGGKQITRDGLDQGYFIEPTIVTDLPIDSRVAQEEIFGPVLVVQTFKTEEEAVAIANSTAFGLASGVWSKDIDRAMRVARRMKAGSTWINTYNRLIPEAETGGYKESGIGRSGGREGILEFTEVKHIMIDHTPLR